jgi:hypothetical protein
LEIDPRIWFVPARRCPRERRPLNVSRGRRRRSLLQRWSLWTSEYDFRLSPSSLIFFSSQFYIISFTWQPPIPKFRHFSGKNIYILVMPKLVSPLGLLLCWRKNTGRVGLWCDQLVEYWLTVNPIVSHISPPGNPWSGRNL